MNVPCSYLCFFLPEFHCELNPIECVGDQSNHYCGVYSNFTLPKLRTTRDTALGSVSLDLISKYYHKLETMKRPTWKEQGWKGGAMETAVKKYKSHRRVFSQDINLVPILPNSVACNCLTLSFY